MSFFRKLKGKSINIISKGNPMDIIEFIEHKYADDIILRKLYRTSSEDIVKNKAKLIVRAGQHAIIICEKKVIHTFSPGTYILTPQYLPTLPSFQEEEYGLSSSSKADVYFTSTRSFISRRWGTQHPIILNDNQFGMIELRSYGTYTFKICDAEKFAKEVVGSFGDFYTSNVEKQLRNTIVTCFADSICETQLPIEAYVSNLDKLSAAFFDYMRDDFTAYGMNFIQFSIENISIPKNIRNEISELSHLSSVDFDKLVEMKAAKAKSATQNLSIETRADTKTEPEQVTQTSNENQQQIERETPPPINPSPSSIFYIAIDKEQMGPYDITELRQMVKSEQFTRETLVWTSGMINWEAASSRRELDTLWGQTPPPILLIQ